mmetsp:Transcript_5881/g.15087  ORF Transcript_5881/g.15087 Transcript_5881/m.15087 type:complete len:263 (+) Transcript_5881:622-1410(+)
MRRVFGGDARRPGQRRRAARGRQNPAHPDTEHRRARRRGAERGRGQGGGDDGEGTAGDGHAGEGHHHPQVDPSAAREPRQPADVRRLDRARPQGQHHGFCRPNPAPPNAQRSRTQVPLLPLRASGREAGSHQLQGPAGPVGAAGKRETRGAAAVGPRGAVHVRRRPGQAAGGRGGAQPCAAALRGGPRPVHERPARHPHHQRVARDPRLCQDGAARRPRDVRECLQGSPDPSCRLPLRLGQAPAGLAMLWGRGVCVFLVNGR